VSPMTDTNSPKNVASAADVETDSMTGAGNRSSGPTPHRAAYGSGSRPNWRSTLRLTVGLTLNAPAHICRSVPRRRAPNARTERRQMSPPGAPDRHIWSGLPDGRGDYQCCGDRASVRRGAGLCPCPVAMRDAAGRGCALDASTGGKPFPLMQPMIYMQVSDMCFS
jgi:hypothetical protein